MRRREKYLATISNTSRGDIISCGFVLIFPQSKTLQVDFSTLLYTKMSCLSCTNQKSFSVNIWELDRNDCTKAITFNATPSDPFLQKWKKNIKTTLLEFCSVLEERSWRESSLLFQPWKHKKSFKSIYMIFQNSGYFSKYANVDLYLHVQLFTYYKLCTRIPR